MPPIYENTCNAEGHPTGGKVEDLGISIKWQEGTMGPDRQQKNGALLDEVIEACIQRLRFFQSAASGQYACRENAVAITHLEEAEHWLWRRSRNRSERGVLGTYSP